MFSKETYIRRRQDLKRLVGEGIVVLFGNNEAPYNYPANAYAPMRQDSSFLYYFGQHRDGLVGVIDIDNDEEWLFGDDIDVEDIVWMGFTPSVADLAAEVGIAKTAPMKSLTSHLSSLTSKNVHFLPPYRFDTKIQIMDLLGIHPSQQKEKASLKLIQAVVKMRATKEPQEIEVIERACDVGFAMHTLAQMLIKPGVTERLVAGQVDGIARSLAQGNSFATIFSQHGEIMHGAPSDNKLEDGRLVLCDAGCELEDYCSDHTRTMPVNGKFTQRQLEIYSIVEECHDYVLDVAKPGVKYMDVHFAVCRRMTERLKELGLMKGDTDEAVKAGAHAMFRCPRDVPASRSGTHDGYGCTRHGGTGTDIRGLRRGDTPEPRTVRHQLSAYGPQAGGRFRAYRRARHLFHPCAHRRLESQRTLQGVHQLRQARDV